MKVAAAVLGVSLLFFVGVLTGAGRRESVPPPAAIPLGAVNQPAGSGASGPSSPAGAPNGGAKGTTTTTGRTGTTAPPVAGTTPTTTTGAPTTAGTSATATTTSSPPTTTESGQVQQVDNQVDCTPAGKRGKGKREPCPSTTSSTGAPGGGGNG